MIAGPFEEASFKSHLRDVGRVDSATLDQLRWQRYVRFSSDAL